MQHHLQPKRLNLETDQSGRSDIKDGEIAQIDLQNIYTKIAL